VGLLTTEGQKLVGHQGIHLAATKEALSPSVRPGAEGVAPLLLQLPDLTITRLYLSGTGTSTCLNVVLANQGTAPAYNVALSLKQKELGIHNGILVNLPGQVSVLQPGQSTTLTYNIYTTFHRLNEPGNMIYTATADPNNLIAELNENNNTAQVYS
jgi:hypothetical protein